MTLANAARALLAHIDTQPWLVRLVADHTGSDGRGCIRVETRYEVPGPLRERVAPGGKWQGAIVLWVCVGRECLR